MRRQQPESVDQPDVDPSADVASHIIRACDLVIDASRRGSRHECSHDQLGSLLQR
jgi:hypothetical protein